MSRADYLSKQAEIYKQGQACAVAAIQFALGDDDGIDFLRYWNAGEFDVLRREWPDAPEAVYIGADQFHPETRRE
jgi:hypothetical protein